MDLLYCIWQYIYLAVTNTCRMVFLLQGSYLSVHKGVMKHNGWLKAIETAYSWHSNLTAGESIYTTPRCCCFNISAPLLDPGGGTWELTCAVCNVYRLHFPVIRMGSHSTFMLCTVTSDSVSGRLCLAAEGPCTSASITSTTKWIWMVMVVQSGEFPVSYFFWQAVALGSHCLQICYSCQSRPHIFSACGNWI